MRIVTVRRISQIFFFALFLWFCIVSSVGLEWWQLRGWPVSWLLQLDPLVALSSILTTQTLYAGLLWALATVALTILLGRFFCSWVCPFGSIHHFVSFLGSRGKPASARIEANRHHPGQSVKYYVLIFLLSAASGALIAKMLTRAPGSPIVVGVSAVGSVVLVALTLAKITSRPRKVSSALLLLLGVWTALALIFSVDRMLASSLQSGLLDPIPLVYRSVNLVLVPLADATMHRLSAGQRFYDGAWLIALIFFAAVLLNLKFPRFYCRFVCPLGALYGVLGRFALWRVGKAEGKCSNCELCSAQCEGACSPHGRIRVNECVLCMNCLHDCRHGLIGYRTQLSASGESTSPDISRRGLLITMASGIAAVPILRLGGGAAANWSSAVIRPPGALSEEQFLSRCIKCGQCMRVCPTNIIQPAGLEAGLEGLWTPTLNFRIGSSGCQLNCVICGHICPTAAIRPLTPDEKLGRNDFAKAGPLRMGTAFVDRGRCLPWAMDRPCIVCQENCPVSPKAIFTREDFLPVRGGSLTVKKVEGQTVAIDGSDLQPARFATGDYYLVEPGAAGGVRRLIADNGAHTISLAPDHPWQSPPQAGSTIEVQVRLQRPQVDPEHCIGCGVCEHECPVSGRRGIRITAENESRSKKHSMFLRSS